MIEIDCLRNKNDWKDFLKLPWKIYKNNKYWIPPLLSEVKTLLDTRKHPF